MLYVSRYVGQTKYGVVDTDDGVETVVTYQDLTEYVINNGLDIKGVTIGYTVRKRRRVPYISSVKVYQNGSFLTGKQAKTKTLKGIDIIVNNGQIVQINVPQDGLKQPTTIKLSEYGTSCGEYIFKFLPFLSNSALTIELDDSVAVSAKTFKYFVNRGVVLDMSAVTNPKVVEYVAHELSTEDRWLEREIVAVIDTPQRMDYYIAETILNRPTNGIPKIKSISDVVSDPKAVNILITKKHRSEFKGVSRAQLIASKSVKWAHETKRFVNWLASYGWLSKCENYETLVNRNCLGVLACLRECSMCNNNVLLRFENYLRYFTPTDEVQEAFVQLFRNASQWLFDIGMVEGWIREVNY